MQWSRLVDDWNTSFLNKKELAMYEYLTKPWSHGTFAKYPNWLCWRKINLCFNLENLSKKINTQQFFVHFLVKSLTKTHEQKLVVLFFWGGEPQTWGRFQPWLSLTFLMIPGFTDVWWGPENEIHCFGPEFWNKLFWGCKGMANLTRFCGVLPSSPRRGTAVMSCVLFGKNLLAEKSQRWGFLAVGIWIIWMHLISFNNYFIWFRWL